MLDELANPAHSIPFLAVFCANKPDQPRVLADWFTKEDLLKILSACPDPLKNEAIISSQQEENPGR